MSKNRTHLPRRAASAWSRVVVVIAAALAIVCGSSPAFAYGRVEWKSTTVEERSTTKSWHLEIKLFLPSAPDMAHMPMKFEFEPVAYYERSMVDGDKLVERRVPLQNRQALIESVDVGFMDPGSGQIQSRTKFTFKVTRAHGYEAGEYKVTIRDSRNGRTIGTPTTLKFAGENEIIDRRSIVFTGKKKEDKAGDKAEGSSQEDEKNDDESSDATDDAEPEYEDYDDEDDDGAVPPSVEGKPGGCGCHHGPPHEQPLLWLAIAALGLGLVMRRKARS